MVLQGVQTTTRERSNKSWSAMRWTWLQTATISTRKCLANRWWHKEWEEIGIIWKYEMKAKPWLKECSDLVTAIEAVNQLFLYPTASEDME